MKAKDWFYRQGMQDAALGLPKPRRRLSWPTWAELHYNIGYYGW